MNFIREHRIGNVNDTGCALRVVRQADGVVVFADGLEVTTVPGRWPASQPGLFTSGVPCRFNYITHFWRDPDGDGADNRSESIAGTDPLSSNSAHNPFSGLTGTPTNAYHGAIVAAKTRGAQFFPTSRFIHAAMAMLSYAHAQASSSTTYCAWYGSTTNYPKGNNNNALRDTNDTSVIWVSDGYSNAGKTGSAGFGGGSGNVFAKSTHNGQNCGVADLNGNMWEINLGLTSDGTNIYVMNTAVAMKSVTSGNTLATDAWGATGIAAMYTSLGATYESLTKANDWVLFGSSNQVLVESTSGNGWALTGAGIPKSGGTGGSNAFGQDGNYQPAAWPNELCPISGGAWNNGSYAGVWALFLSLVRGNSNANVGFRSASYP